MIENFSEERIRNRHSYSYSILCREKIEDKKIKEIPPVLVKVIDISYSGIGLTSNKPLSVDQVYVLNFKLSEQSRKVKFKIVWINQFKDAHLTYGYRLGGQFIDVTKDDLFFVHDIITNIRAK